MVKINVNSISIVTTILYFVLFAGFSNVLAHDVNGDGREGLAEAIHALQTVAGSTALPVHIPAPVPRTGQTACFDDSGSLTACAGTGQDGEFRTGIPWPAPRFTDHGDGTIRDNLTGLTWLQDANCIATAITWFDEEEVSGDGKVHRATGQNFIDALNDGIITNQLPDGTLIRYVLTCGDTSNGGRQQSDWRMPNRFELESLLSLASYDPALPGSGYLFNNVESDNYWTSSHNAYYAHGLGVGWTVDFYAGIIENKSWSLETSYVWPVRGPENESE